MLRGARFFNQSPTIRGSDFLVRSKHFNEGYKLQPFGQTFLKSYFHQPQSSTYPAVKQLPLPLNIEDLASSEKLKFCPQRSRDISASYISSSTSTFTNEKLDLRQPIDERIECYDCSGTINLSSTMQTNVPFPFVSRGKPIHLNMPGGQWRQDEKYISADLNNVHHMNTRQLHFTSGTGYSLGSNIGAKYFYSYIPSGEASLFSNVKSFNNFNICHFRKFYTTEGTMNSDKDLTKSVNQKTESKKKQYINKLKVLVKDYGPVIIIFHVSISLVSLGICYFLISRGFDLTAFVKNFGVSEGAGAAGTAAGFVVAYGVHKAIAPARLGLTITAAPFIVKKLRKLGILKSPQSKI